MDTGHLLLALVDEASARWSRRLAGPLASQEGMDA